MPVTAPERAVHAEIKRSDLARQLEPDAIRDAADVEDVEVIGEVLFVDGAGAILTGWGRAAAECRAHTARGAMIECVMVVDDQLAANIRVAANDLDEALEEALEAADLDEEEGG